MVKKVPTKAEQRAALEKQMRNYLDDGGSVHVVPRGTSGSDARKPQQFQSTGLFSEPPAKRTFVPEVIAAIESRRGEMKRARSPSPKRSRLPKPRRKTVYDDFGEPIRKVWVEE